MDCTQGQLPYHAPWLLLLSTRHILLYPPAHMPHCQTLKSESTWQCYLLPTMRNNHFKWSHVPVREVGAPHTLTMPGRRAFVWCCPSLSWPSYAEATLDSPLSGAVPAALRSKARRAQVPAPHWASPLMVCSAARLRIGFSGKFARHVGHLPAFECSDDWCASKQRAQKR